VLLQADVDVDPIRPEVDVVHIGQIPGSEAALLGLPGLGQLGDHRCGQAGGGAEELAQSRHEIPGRQSVQVEQRQYLGDLRCLATPGRQNRRGEPRPLAGVGVDAAVVDPRRSNLDRSSAGEHLTSLVRAVADDQSAAVLVAIAGELGEVSIDLGSQGLSQHPTSTVTDDLVDQRRARAAGSISVGTFSNYGEQGSYLPDRRWRADLA
jgi:hypothetical protein